MACYLVLEPDATQSKRRVGYAQLPLATDQPFATTPHMQNKTTFIIQSFSFSSAGR